MIGMSTSKKYQELKAQLEAEIAWFDSEEVTIEEASKHYKKAKEILKELEKILDDSELEIQKLN